MTSADIGSTETEKDLVRLANQPAQDDRLSEMKTRTKRLVPFAIGALIAPPSALSVCLFLSRWPVRTVTEIDDYLFIGGSLLLGVLIIALMPLSAKSRGLLLLGYVPIASYLLFMYCFLFIGLVFDLWL